MWRYSGAVTHRSLHPLIYSGEDRGCGIGVVRRARSLWAEPLCGLSLAPLQLRKTPASGPVRARGRPSRAEGRTGLVSGSLGTPAAPAPGLVQRATASLPVPSEGKFCRRRQRHVGRRCAGAAGRGQGGERAAAREPDGQGPRDLPAQGATPAARCTALPLAAEPARRSARRRSSTPPSRPRKPPWRSRPRRPRRRAGRRRAARAAAARRATPTASPSSPGRTSARAPASSRRTTSLRSSSPATTASGCTSTA